MSPFRQRPLRPLLAALGLAVVLGGCDFSDDDDDVIVGSDIVLVRFSFDGDQYQLSADGLIASFESDEIEDASERRDVQDALAGAAGGPLRPLLAALGLAVVLGGCDFSDDDDDVIVGSDIVLVRFSFDGDQYQLSADGLIASFESDEIEDASERRDVQDALAGAADGALVLLYVDGGLVFDGGEGTWAAR